MPPRYFHPLGSFFKILHSITLIIDLLQPWYRWHYLWLLRPHTFHLLLHWAPVQTIKTRRLAPSLLCLIPAVTRRKHHEFSTWWVVQACRSVWLLGEKLKMVKKAKLQAFWFCYILRCLPWSQIFFYDM